MGLVTKNFSDIITFSRGTNATYTDSTGTLQYAQANMLLYSEQLDDPSWTKFSATVTPNTIVAPDSTTTADKLVADATLNFHTVARAFSFVSGVSYTLSIFAKAGEYQYLSMTGGNTGIFPARVTFDLTAGTVASTVLGTASIQSAGGGWFRCSVSATAITTASTNCNFAVSSTGSYVAYTGDGVSGIYIWGAQLNPGALQTYIATTGTAYYGPRFDYNPTTLAPLGFLVEEARTNSIRNNTMVGAVAASPGTEPTNWSSTSTASGITRTIVGTGVENGIAYIDYRYVGTPTAGTNLAISCETSTGVAATLGQTWVESVYVTLQAGSFTNVSVTVSILGVDSVGAGTESFGSAVITSTSTSLIKNRYSGAALLASATTTNVIPRVRVGYTVGLPIDITLRLGLPQLELGAFATSVIPTASVATTRSADLAAVNTLSPWYNAAAFTIYSEFNSPVPTTISANAVVAGFDDGTANNRFGNFYSSSTSLVAANQVTAGVADFSISVGVSTLANVQKQASRYQAGNYATSVNGTAVVASLVAPAPPAVTTLRFGLRPSGTQANMWLRKVTVYPQGLDNATLQAITT